MRLPWALLLLCVPGCWSLSGPKVVTGTEGGSLSVQCRYEKEYKTFTKYWCRQPCLPLISDPLETSGEEERRDRVSISDDPENLFFTVTLENLTMNDAGKYRCGISTMMVEDGLSSFLPEPLFQVQVFVSPASSSESPGGPPAPPGQEPRSLLSSVHFLLLIFLKVPLFLSMLGAVLWVHRPQRGACGQTPSAKTTHGHPRPSISCLELQPLGGGRKEMLTLTLPAPSELTARDVKKKH